MTPTEFYTVLRDAALYSPAVDKIHDQINTFAVLRYRSELNAENLNKGIAERHREYFWTRRNTETFDFPALVVFERNMERRNPFAKNKEDCFKPQLAVVYPHVEKASPSLMCEYLIPQDIYNLCRSLLDYTLGYLEKVVYTPTGWKHIKQNVEFNRTKTRSFQLSLRQNNNQLNGDFIDDEGLHNLCGVSFNLTYCSQKCEEFEPDFTQKQCC